MKAKVINGFYDFDARRIIEKDEIKDFEEARAAELVSKNLIEIIAEDEEMLLGKMDLSDLLKMKKNELEELATEMGLDVKGNKEDLAKAISEATVEIDPASIIGIGEEEPTEETEEEPTEETEEEPTEETEAN